MMIKSAPPRSINLALIPVPAPAAMMGWPFLRVARRRSTTSLRVYGLPFPVQRLGINVLQNLRAGLWALLRGKSNRINLARERRRVNQPAMSDVEVPHHVANDEHKRVGIFISVLAVLMALVSSLARNQANEIIVKEVQASNGFAWYQAKRQRSHLNELELQRAEFELAGNPTEAQRKILAANKARVEAKNAEYKKENEEILSKAEADKTEARLAEHKHHWLEYGEI